MDGKHKQTQRKVTGILQELAAQIIAINMCTNWSADMTYDGDSQSILITVLNEKFEMVHEQEQSFDYDKRSNRIRAYTEFQKMRIKLTEMFNQAKWEMV